MIRSYAYHACRNRHCELYRREVPGTAAGICPRCGWVRRLAVFVTRAVTE